MSSAHTDCYTPGVACVLARAPSTAAEAPLLHVCPPQAEQREVEDYYVKSGMLLASYHKLYWTGLTTERWPMFYWTDNVVPREQRRGCSALLLISAACVSPSILAARCQSYLCRSIQWDQVMMIAMQNTMRICTEQPSAEARSATQRVFHPSSLLAS